MILYQVRNWKTSKNRSRQHHDATRQTTRRWKRWPSCLWKTPTGFLLYRDELTGWLRSLDKVGHETARAFYLEAWNGDGSHEVDRIGRGSLFIKAVCVSVLGGIQPGPLSAYVEGAFDNGEAADGLLQRLQVLVYPDRPDFDPTDLSPDLEARERAYKVFERLAEFDVAGFLGHAPDDDEVPYVQFDDKARRFSAGGAIRLKVRLSAGSILQRSKATL